jgi:hypothetical protein
LPVDEDEFSVPFKDIVRMKWVLAEKFHADGTFNRRKGRLVACQIARGFNVTDTFSPTVAQESVRLVLQIAVSHDCYVFSLDVAGAYLFATPSEETILHCPPHLADIIDDSDFPRTRSGKRAKFFKATRSIYGLQKSCQEWYLCYTAFLVNLGYTASTVDACIWFKFISISEFQIILVFSDDSLVAGRGIILKGELLKAYETEFVQSPDSGGDGGVTEFLGLKVDRHPHRIVLSAPKLINRLPALLESQPASAETPLSKEHGCDEPVSETNPLIDPSVRDLRKALGLILWISLSVRPDCCFSCCFLARYVGRSPTRKVAAQVDRLGWYLYYTRDTHLLTFNKSDDVFRGSVDASFGNVFGSMKSWYGYNCTLGSGTGVVAYRATIARSVVTSTRDSELIAAVHVVYHVFQLRLLLSELGLRQLQPTPPIVSDSMATVLGVRLPSLHRDSRWMAIRFQAIKQAVQDLLVTFDHIPGKDNSSDIHTKILDASSHHRHSMTVLGTPLSSQQVHALIHEIEVIQE